MMTAPVLWVWRALRRVATWITLGLPVVIALGLLYRLLLPGNAKAALTGHAWLASMSAGPWWLWLTLALDLVGIYLAWRFITRRRAVWPTNPQDDGIRVGEAKAFDSRSLTLMYEELIDRVRTIDGIQRESVAGAIGTQQGTQSSGLSMGFGAAAPATDKDPEKPPAPVTERSADLLNDQTNLALQAFQLRLMLERSLSDRIFDAASGTARRQAVIGIPVSIDPPWFAVGCSARVEVRFRVKNAGGKDSAPSLVGLLPQEKTYNLLGVDTQSWQTKAAGKALKLLDTVQVLFRQTRQRQQRRSDTVAFELAPGKDNQLSVAWEFRPVDGERTVAAGLKPVIAVLALPMPDDRTDATVAVETRTSWHAWSPNNQISRMYAGWRALFSDRMTRTEWSAPAILSVPASDVTDEALRPTIYKIEWVPVGADKAAVLINGQKFFTGTSVVLGGTTLAKPQDGLTIKSDQVMQVIVPMDSLLREGVLNGRYGQSIPLARDAGTPPLLTGVMLAPTPDGSAYFVSLTIKPRQNAKFTRQQFLDLPWPLLLVGGKLVNSAVVFSDPIMVKDPKTNQDTENIQEVTASAVVPAIYLPSMTTVISLHWPFFLNWTLTTYSFDPGVALRVIRTRTNTGKTWLLFTGTDFDPSETVIVLDRSYRDGDLKYPDPSRKDLISIEIDEISLQVHTQVLVCQRGRRPIGLDVPRQDPAGFSISSVSIQKLKLNTAAVLELSGTGMTAVEKATLDGSTELSTFASPDGMKLIVQFSADATATAGQKTLVLRGRDSHTAEVLVEVG